MSDQFGDLESGTRGRGGDASAYFSRTNQDDSFGFETPGDGITQRRRVQQQTRGPTTARLRRVSTQYFQSGGRDEGFGAEFGDGDKEEIDRGVERDPTATAQSRKFVRSDPVPDEFMLDIEVTLRKQDYGEPGSSDYRKNMAMATAGLSEKFGVARHKILAGGEEGDQSKHAHVQQVIVGVLHRVKEGWQRSRQMDFMDICTVPRMVGDSRGDPRRWWDNSEINLWTDWDLCEYPQIRRWQWCVNKYFSDEDRIASNWLQSFVYNSSTDSLRSAVDKKYTKLPSNQKGGVTYLFLTLCEMFMMSREVKEAMTKFLDIFKRNGISRYTGENVLVASEEIIGVCKRLDAVNALQEEHVLDILAGLSICTNARFRGMFQLLKQSAELGNLSILPDMPFDPSPMECIEVIMEKAIAKYDKECTAQTWNKTTRGGPSTNNAIVEMVNACWNCGDHSHGVSKCPKPKNQATIEKNKKAFQESKSGGGGARGGGGRLNRRDREAQKAEKRNDPDYQRKVWESNSCKFLDGKLHINCKTCGFNLTHGSRQHSEWNENRDSFRLPQSHFYMKECRRLNQANGFVTAPTTSTSTGPATSSSQGPTISISRAQLEQTISNFERTSTDPNATALTDMLRSLFLN
jgi:hypothetical protein